MIKMKRGSSTRQPDLAVEVLTKQLSWQELQRKAKAYVSAGTPVVWLVDRQRRTVEVIRPGVAALTLDETRKLEDADVLPGFSMAVARRVSLEPHPKRRRDAADATGGKCTGLLTHRRRRR